MKRSLQMLAGAVLLALAPSAMAQTTTGTTTAPVTKHDHSMASPGQSRVASRLASNFTGLAGSKENALALVNALRSGTEVTLVTAPAGGTGDPVSTTFTPPTGKMGWGNVSHSLSLAQNVLARAGITHPTNAELQAALLGGDVTAADGSTVALKGILQMRADGMGWGQIAQASGTRMGAVVSSTKGMQPKATTATSTTSATPSASKSSGVTPAAGAQTTASAGKGSPRGVTTASGVSSSPASRGTVTADGSIATHGRSTDVTTGGSGYNNGNAYGRGLVTAAGGSAGAGAGAMTAASRGQGTGLVAASGAPASSSASLSTAGVPGNGNGNGNAFGQGGGKGKGG